MKDQPPKNSLRFLRWFCREDYIEELEGDLTELFHRQYNQSPARARLQFTRNVTRYFRPGFIKNFRSNYHPNSIAMFRNYLKAGWRNLTMRKLFSAINITGLSFSVAFCLLLFFYIRHEQSYDTFHVNKDRIFRLEMSNMFPSPDAAKKKSLFSFLNKSDNEKNQLVFPEVVAANMQQTFPEIKNIVRFKDQGEQSLKINNQVYREKHVVLADSNFFTCFSFPLIKGHAATALRSTANVVVSKSLARKYFGNEEAIGKTIALVNHKDQVLMIRNPTWDNDFTKRVRERLNQFEASHPSIVAVSGMNGGLDGSYNTNGFMLNGEQKWLRQLAVDYNYFEMLGLKFVQGRPFSKDIQADTSRTQRPSIVNETLFRMLGKDAQLGVYNDAIRSTIIGVVKDYNFESLSKKIEPQQHVLTTKYEQYFMVKIRAGDIQPTIASLQKEWKQITGDYPFDYKFLDDSIAKLYEADIRWQNIMQSSCFFAIFIACLGLFGLSAINAVNRTKEIGIRKVLGATVKDIVGDLSRSFVLMFIIAIIISTPLAYWLMNEWLQNFAYRIDLSWWIFVIVGAIALSVALLTVSFQAIRAAIANPVNSLVTANDFGIINKVYSEFFPENAPARSVPQVMTFPGGILISVECIALV